MRLAATAVINSCGDQQIRGTATLRERASEEVIKLVEIPIEVRGLTDGQHAVHIHETGVCEPCGAARGHHDPGPFGKSTPDAPDFNHPFHGGDLLNREITSGVGKLRTTSSRFTLSPERLSVFDEDGSALIIHTNADTYCDDESELKPGCAGGARDACGVLVLD
jgi:Cu-Zn family superoxide dismutase